MARQRKQRHRGRAGGNDVINEQKRFASISASRTTVGNTSISRTLTKDRLRNMLQDPRSNAVAIASASKGMRQTNSAYGQILRYYSNLLTYDHVLFPAMENPLAFSEDADGMKEQFSQTAIALARYNIKYYLPTFTSRMFTTGTVFLYKVEDGKSIDYMELPVDYCRISLMQEGVFRYQFNLNSVNEESVLTYPKEIQTAWQSMQNGGNIELEDNQWFQLSDKAVAFTIDEYVLNHGGMAVPPLASSLLDSIRIENAKAKMEADAELDNVKVIHSKIETDDRGRPLMEMPIVMEFHNAIKKNLPDGAVAVTNPFETTAVNLSGSGKDAKFALLEQANDQFYRGVGVSSMLFGAEGASSQALERSIQADCQFMYSTVLPMYANYFNYELRKIAKKNGTWRLKFLKVSHFFQDEAISTAKDQLSWGGSRLEYLATVGMTPIEVVNMMVFEQEVLSIDDYMIAKQTSYTQSGGDGAGRPESDNPTDTTIRINDQE